MPSKPIRIIKGDSHTLTWNFTNAATDAAIDMSSGTFTFTVKKSLSTTDANAAIQKTGSDFSVSTGTVTLALSSTDTKISSGIYLADLQYVASGKVQTYGIYDLEIIGEVTLNE